MSRTGGTRGDTGNFGLAGGPGATGEADESSHSVRASECEVLTTRTGMRAMLDRAAGEVMHPIIGPRAEAEALYVAPSQLVSRLAGTSHATENETPLTLLDVGLGAGSNAVAAFRASEMLPTHRVRGRRRLAIVSFDRSVAAMKLALEPEHRDAFGFDAETGAAAKALLTNGHFETERTSWRLVLGSLPAALSNEGDATADIVFWDPFSPRANPDLWTVAAFAAVRRLCRTGATLHTYSGATATRAALLLAGFAVGIGEPTGTNKFATMGALTSDDLARPLDLRWLARLARSSAPFPPDAPIDALAQIAAHAQFREGAVAGAAKKGGG